MFHDKPVYHDKVVTNVRQSHDKRATILRHACHCQAMWCQAIRGRNMRSMHMLKLCAPPLFENPGSAPASLLDVHLVVYAMQSNHGQFFWVKNKNGQFFNSRCARRDAQTNIAKCTGCIAAAMFLRWSHFRNVLKWMYISSARA